MAKKSETTVNEAKKNYVPVFLFRGEGKYNAPTLNVIINGVKYSVPRGKTVMVPPEVAMVIERSENGDAYAQQIDESMQKEQVMYM